MTTTAEPIAKVIADLRRGAIRRRDGDLTAIALGRVVDPVVVDATAVYHSLVARDDPVHLYEDHCIAPPWDEAAIAYVNEHGNVVLSHVTATDHDGKEEWDTQNPVDWPAVRWILDAFVWLGGRSSDKGPFPTSGPAHLWRLAVYPDGSPADIRWAHLVPEYPMSNWDMANLVLLGALNFVNCRNVELVEPQRPRSERRRLARTGVSVHVLNVLPVSRSTRSRGGDGAGAGTPLTSVRGHFACYGPKYDRGLLFGKYAGRFWIPQHARGTADLGEHRTSYRLLPGVDEGRRAV